MESMFVPIYKKGDKTNCSNYRGVSLLATTYKIVVDILLLKLTTYAEIWGSSMWISKQQVKYCILHSSSTSKQVKMGMQ
jgi:hypothetical protein